MNPLMTFLIVVPFAAAVILTVGAALGLLKHGARWDILAAFIIFIILSTFLGFLFLRISKSPLLELPGSAQSDIMVRKRATTFVLAVTYGTLLIIFVLFFNLEHIQNWIGVVSLFLGVSMIYSGINHLKQATKPQKELTAQEVKQYEALAEAYKKTKIWLILSSVLTGSFVPIIFIFFDGPRYISVLDLSGLLFLLASIMIWLILRGVSAQKRLIFLTLQQNN
jgi:hypothetical protein